MQRSGSCFRARYLRDEITTERILEVNFNSSAGAERIVMPADKLGTDVLRRKIRARGVEANTVDVQRIFANASASVVTATRRTGFKGPRTFVMPKQNLGIGRGEFQLVQQANFDSRIGTYAGTPESWRRDVGTIATRSSYISFAISTALSCLLPAYVELHDPHGPPLVSESGIFNFHGESASGKTTLLKCGMSVVGPPEPLMNWDFSRRSIEEICAAHNDLPLILDDLETCEESGSALKKTIRMITQLVATGRSRGRSVIVSDRLPALHWRTVGLVSSPLSLRAQAAELNWSPTQGELVRFIDIPMPARTEGGVFDRLARGESSAEMITEIQAAINASYGTLFQLMIRHLMRRDLSTFIRRKSADLVEALVTTRNPWERRLAEKFALSAVAGEIAIRLGLLPWPRGWAKESAETCFKACATGLRSEIDPIGDFARRLLARVDDRDGFILRRELSGTLNLPHSSDLLTTHDGNEVIAIRDETLSEFPRALRGQLQKVPGLYGRGHGGKATLQVRANIRGEETRLRFHLLRRDVLQRLAS